MLVDPSPFNDPVLAMHGALALGVVGAIGGQLAVFGLGVYAAAMAHGLCGRASDFLDRTIEFLVRARVRLVALLLGAVGFLGLAGATIYRLVNGHDPYASPAVLVSVALCLLFGFQLLSASAFLSAFRGLQFKLSPTAGE